MRHLARRRRPLVPGLLAAASLITVALLAPPAQADGYDDPVLPAPTTPPPAGSVTPEETVLPPKTPDYFEALYPYYLSAPLPAKIYKRGGIPAVVCGPGDIAQAHTADEWIELAQIVECERYLRALVFHLSPDPRNGG